MATLIQFDPGLDYRFEKPRFAGYRSAGACRKPPGARRP